MGLSIGGLDEKEEEREELGYTQCDTTPYAQYMNSLWKGELYLSKDR